jgi:YD repeat-containing protein
MMKGSLGTTYRRCGKPNCRCAGSKTEGHRFTKLMWNDADGPKSRTVQEDQFKKTSEAIQQHREFKQLRKKLQFEQHKLDILLHSFEDETSSENRKKMGFE